jgi:hypothetical protein
MRRRRHPEQSAVPRAGRPGAEPRDPLPQAHAGCLWRGPGEGSARGRGRREGRGGFRWPSLAPPPPALCQFNPQRGGGTGPFQTLSLESYSRNPFLPWPPAPPPRPAGRRKAAGWWRGWGHKLSGQEAFAQLSLSFAQGPATTTSRQCFPPPSPPPMSSGCCWFGSFFGERDRYIGERPQLPASFLSVPLQESCCLSRDS